MQTMNSPRFRVPAFTPRFFLLLAVTAFLTVLLVRISGAPFWVLYFGGIVGAPFIFHAVRSVERVPPDSLPGQSGTRKLIQK
jgi:hypothetical protein